MPQTMQILLETFREKLRFAIAAVIELWDQGKIFTREEVLSCMGQLESAASELLEVKSVALSEVTPQFLEIVDLSIRAHVKHVKLIGERNFSLICKEFFRIAMFPDLPTLDISKLTSKFARNGVVANLGRLFHLTCLILPRDYNCGGARANRVALSIKHLPNLRQFEYTFKCNDYIVREICFHCRYISDLNIKYSKKVTDFCVALLVKKEQLTRLDVSFTSISDLGYRELVAKLPLLRKLSWKTHIDEVLKAADENHLQNVVEFDGILWNYEDLIRKCPNLEDMVVRSAGSDMRPFTRLESLKTLHLIGFNCSLSNLATVLHAIGPRLQTLFLENMFDLDIVVVIQNCVNLKRLVIKSCHFVPGLPKREFQNSTHFHQLVELILCYNTHERILMYNNHAEWYLQILNQYSFLKVLKGRGVPVFNDEYFLRIFNEGGFSCLRDLFLYNCGELGESTFNAFYRFCPNLVSIGCLTHWSRLPNYRIEVLLRMCRDRHIEIKQTDCDVATETICLDV